MSTHVVSPIEFDGTEIEVSGAAHHHLFRVKRLAAGDEVRIVDGEGRARRSVVARVDRTHAVLALGSAEPSRESGLGLDLLVAPAKPDRAAWMVEKTTELGVRAIRFVSTARSASAGRELGAAQLLRLRRVAIAAVEQCGRSVVPEVSGPEPVERALDRLAAAAPVAGGIVVLDPEGAPPRSLIELAGARSLAVLVGPEGGWTADELARLDGLGARRVALGERVLRVETAAIAAAAILLAAADPRP